MHTTAFEDSPPSALPCAGGLLAGTLALMTAWAGTDAAEDQQQRMLMARKIASNLFFLRQHPDLAPGLRQVIGTLHQRWVLLAHALPPDDSANASDPTRHSHAGAADPVDLISALH